MARQMLPGSTSTKRTRYATGAKSGVAPRKCSEPLCKQSESWPQMSTSTSGSTTTTTRVALAPTFLGVLYDRNVRLHRLDLPCAERRKALVRRQPKAARSEAERRRFISYGILS